MLEQQMNLDLKVAYDYGREWIRRHEPITVDWLVLLASKVMARTARHHCQHLQADIDQFVKSTTEKVADKQDLKQKMVDKWSIKPSLAEKMVDILEFVADKDQITTEAIVAHFGFTPTTAKRYLRQLTEFGYLESHGGNKNRTYTKK